MRRWKVFIKAFQTAVYIMPTMPLMIATFAYLNAKRFEPDTFVIDVRVSSSV